MINECEVDISKMSPEDKVKLVCKIIVNKDNCHKSLKNSALNVAIDALKYPNGFEMDAVNYMLKHPELSLCDFCMIATDE